MASINIPIGPVEICAEVVIIRWKEKVAVAAILGKEPQQVTKEEVLKWRREGGSA